MHFGYTLASPHAVGKGARQEPQHALELASGEQSGRYRWSRFAGDLRSLRGEVDEAARLLARAATRTGTERVVCVQSKRSLAVATCGGRFESRSGQALYALLCETSRSPAICGRSLWPKPACAKFILKGVAASTKVWT